MPPIASGLGVAFFTSTCKNTYDAAQVFSTNPPDNRENPSEKNTRQQYSVAELTNNSIII
jgi:hypothetical protein